MPQTLWRGIAEDFAPRRLPSTLITGLILALVNALLAVALMTLIFAGELSGGIATGIGIGLVGSGVISLVVALTSGFAGMYAGIQDSSAAILGLAGATIASSVVFADALVTVIAMMAVTSLATGLLLIVMARLHLGEVARFVPFPVIGGILAGTGYLIAVAAVDQLSAGSLANSTSSADSLGLFWPGVVIAGFFFVATRRSWSPRAYATSLVLGIAAFHLVTRSAGIGRADALDRGWLLGPFPEGMLLPEYVGEALVAADWASIASQTPSLLTILLIVPLNLLLYLSALEIGTKRDLDVDVELRATGWANVAASAVGSPPGYIFLSDTVITHRLIGDRRGPAIVASLGLIVIALLGGSILELLPKFVIGGLLLFVGVEFLYDWLWASLRRMNRIDYILMVGIIIVIATLGFLPGVATGLIAAIATFVYRYSRIDVVKHLLTAKEHQSNIERSQAHTEYIEENGEAVLILELQGFIFFGTANQILSQVRERLSSTPDLRYVICDFRLVSGVDSSAVALFERIAHVAVDNDLNLLLAGLGRGSRGQFSELLEEYPEVVREMSDLDHAAAWCEDRLVSTMDLTDQLRGLPEGLTERLGVLLTRRTFEAGENLMKQGDPSPGIYLIESGRATVLLDRGDEPAVRLRTLLEGTVLGEISLYKSEPCSATVVAETPCEVLHLTPDSFSHLCQADPGAAAELHLFVARTLAGRVSHANRSIRALQN